METIRNPDGSLVAPLRDFRPVRRHDKVDASKTPVNDSVDEIAHATTRVLHPNGGGYNEALADGDLQQNPNRARSIDRERARRC